MSAESLTQRIKHKAQTLGFTLTGVCPAGTPAGNARFDEWLANGYAGQMYYLANRREAYEHPRHILDGVRSIVMLAMPYGTTEPAEVQPGQGRLARYAWGDADYHDVIRERLHTLADYLRELAPAAATRGVVDTAPLMEREFAQLAGLGWVGKNTLLLNKTAGSYFFLAALLTDVELAYDAPHATDHCGTCTACLDACPTAAFPQPYVLDASRCISYLTIELRDQIPADLREGVGDWLFGCDVCQEVCPWTKRGRESLSANDSRPLLSETLPVFAPHPTLNPINLSRLFDLTEADFRGRFRHTPLWRPHRRGLLRNAAIILGNQRDSAAIPALTKGLNDEESIVRGACAWALGNIATDIATLELQTRAAIETDSMVQVEITAALKKGTGVIY